MSARRVVGLRRLATAMSTWFALGHLVLLALVLALSPSVPANMLRVLDAPVEGVPAGTALAFEAGCFDCPIVILGKVFSSPWAPIPNKILMVLDYPAVRSALWVAGSTQKPRLRRGVQSTVFLGASTLQWVLVGLLVAAAWARLLSAPNPAGSG